MPKKSIKINPTKVGKGSRYVPPVEIPRNGEVSFNFKRLCTKGEKFNYRNKEANYFLALIERLKNVCGMERRALLSNRSNSLRCHPIDFSEARVSEDSFGVLGEDIDNDAWQFQISSNAHGRVHGYFVGDIFYVVWFDPEHELYPGAQT